MQPFLNYKNFIITCLVVSMAAGFAAFTEPNEAVISNGLINAHLYLPNATDGFYRGVRFDWAGVVARLDCNGHSYYGPWFINAYNPTNNDAVTGPVEAFDPLGYDDVKAGGTFVKIGVGTLIKPNDSVYKFSKLYAVANPGKWSIKTKTDQVQFTQTLDDTAYAYKYQKTLKLLKGKPILVISHTLKNTGKHIIETQVFDHNFLVMDKQVTGPGIAVTLPFDLAGVANRRPDYVNLQGNQLTYLKVVEKRAILFTDLTNGKGADNYDIKVENHNTGAAVHITADRPVARMAYWSTSKTICPEPYIKIKVEPGQEFSWTITYEYYTCVITKQPQ